MALDAALVSEAAWCTVAVMGFWGACYVFSFYVTLYDQKTQEIIKSPTRAQRFEAVDIIFALPFYVLLFVLSTNASWELCSDVVARWHGVSFSSRLFQLLYAVRMSTHCPIQWVVMANNPTLRLQMTAHHVLSVICYSGGLITTRMHFWAVLNGCCEFSTIFLNVVFAFKWFAPKKQDTRAAKVSGLMLWLGFVVFRLVLFPMWLWWFYGDISQDAAESWNRVGAIERYFYPLVTAFLLVMSTIWFIPITKGLLKALGLSAPNKYHKQ